jgi:hypothetical protein
VSLHKSLKDDGGSHHSETTFFHRQHKHCETGHARLYEKQPKQTQEFKRSPPFPVDPVAAWAPELERISDADLVGRYFEELATTE